MRPTPADSRARDAARLLPLALAAGLVSACLQPSEPGDTKGGEEARIEEPVRFAGATSSTNWPEQDGMENPVTVIGKADTTLTLRFARGRALDTGFVPVRVRGHLTLFDGIGIPALAPVDSVVVPFEDDTLEVPASLLDGLPGRARDTVTFSLRVQVDSMECLITGLAFSRSRKAYILSPFSENPPSSYLLSVPQHLFQGELDSAGVTSWFPPPQGTEASFYIPGTNRTWRPESFAYISLGPVPKGPYPLRLILVSPDNAGTDFKRLDVFEVTVAKRVAASHGQPALPARYRVGTRILSTRVPASTVLRP